MRLNRTFTLLTASTITIAACGSGGEDILVVESDPIENEPIATESTDDQPGTTNAPVVTEEPPIQVSMEPDFFDPYELPDDPDALLFSLLVGQPHGHSAVNDISITVDGRVFFPVEGATDFEPEGFQAPPASEPQPFLVRQLSPGGLEDLVDTAFDAGLYGEPLDFGDAGITDQGHTTVTIFGASSTVTQSAYALYFDSFDEESQRNREVLRRFVERLGGLRTLDAPTVVDDVMPFEPDAWTVTYGTGYPDSTSLGSDWPLGTDIEGPCVDLDPADFSDGVIPGSYVVAGSEAPNPENPDITTAVTVEVVPAFPWIDC